MVHDVPGQTFDIGKEVGLRNARETITMPPMKISAQITLGEYKLYMAMLKRDSSEAAYRRQLPDSTIGLPENFHEYLSNPYYEAFPAVGVSWDNALNYFRWRTVLANKDSICDTIYRLPRVTEWVAARRYFKTKKSLAGEIDSLYADWTICTTDESPLDYSRKPSLKIVLDYTEFAKPGDPQVFKRKAVMGRSYHYHLEELYEYRRLSYYQDHGYPFIAFRYVIEVLSPQEMKRSQLLHLWKLPS